MMMGKSLSRKIELRLPRLGDIIRSQRLFLQIPLFLLPLLLGVVFAVHFHDPSRGLDVNVAFKLLITASLLTIFIAYAVGAWLTHPVNDEGADVDLGTDGHCQRLYYCARSLPIPETDGVCGPNNGPQCASCTKFQEKMAHKAVLPYMFVLYPGLKLGQWVVPVSCMVLFFALWAAPEQDLTCGPEAWGPMIPFIGNLYLPSTGSKADRRMLGDLAELSLFNPFLRRPSLLLPKMNAPIPPRARFFRTEYFVSDMFILTASTCMFLEGIRYLCKGHKDRKLGGHAHTLAMHGHAVTAPLLGETSPASASSHWSENSDLDPNTVNWQHQLYILAFGAYYIGYQVLLYMLMDYGVANGLMNLTTGIAWELWVPFIEFVLLTALVTGLPRYIFQFGAPHDNPSPMVMMQLMPWLGNELHIMKDHIATALCFAAAHCSDGSTRAVGVMLGYLSLASTVVPLIFLFSSPAAFQALRSSHWPLAEANFMKPQTGTSREKKIKKAIEVGISTTTHDKYIRALTGEVPHAVLHVVFAFFFGGGLFIATAILMSTVKIFCIPLGRSYLRYVIPKYGCSEHVVARFLASAGGLLKWERDDVSLDPIEGSYSFGWHEVLGELRNLYPPLDEDYSDCSGVGRKSSQPAASTPRVGPARAARPSGYTEAGGPTAIADEERDSEDAGNSEPESEDAGNCEPEPLPPVLFDAAPYDCAPEDSDEEPIDVSEVRLFQLLQRVASKDLGIYMAILQILRGHLGWMHSHTASWLVKWICEGNVDEQGLDLIKTIVEMGAKPPTPEIVQEMMDSVQGVSEDLADKVLNAAALAMGRQGQKGSGKVAEQAARDIDIEESDEDEDELGKTIREEKKRHERQVNVACFSIALGVPLLWAVALLVV